jgi:hypothetical protein
MAKFEDYSEGRAFTGQTRTKVIVTLDLTGQNSDKGKINFVIDGFRRGRNVASNLLGC